MKYRPIMAASGYVLSKDKVSLLMQHRELKKMMIHSENGVALMAKCDLYKKRIP